MDKSTTTHAHRGAMLDEVEAEYGEKAYPLRRPAELPRWVTVSSRNEGRSHALGIFCTEEEALDDLRGDLGDWYPVGVVDLDTGAMAEAEPTVTLGEWIGTFEPEPDEDDECAACTDPINGAASCDSCRELLVDAPERDRALGAAVRAMYEGWTEGDEEPGECSNMGSGGDVVDALAQVLAAHGLVIA